MFTEEEKEKAVRMYRLAGDPEKSARLVGASARSVRRWAAAGPAPRRACGGKFKPYGPLARSKALELVADGESYRRVAEIPGISSADVVRSRAKGGGTRGVRMDGGIRRPEGCDRAYPGFDGDEREKTRQLELENDILRGVVGLLKAGRLGEMGNRDKTLLIESLRQRTGRPLKELAGFSRISKSSYECQRAAMGREDEHARLRRDVKVLFEEGGGRWGYRTVWARLRSSGTRAGEKIVRRIMREEGCEVACLKRRRRYSSCGGEISEAPGNLVGRSFHAQGPNQIWPTGIAELKLPGGEKAYLSPVLDRFDGMLASWSIGRHPNADLANSCLGDACATLPPGQHPICRSDRGCHCGWPGWIAICELNGLVRSMSKKDCSPDNAACEGFFGRLENEFFYCRDRDGTSPDEFIALLDGYLRYCNERRIKRSLGWLSPCGYRRRIGLAA